MKKTNLYIVSGGVGKQVLFTNLIEDLAKKDNEIKQSIIEINKRLI